MGLTDYKKKHDLEEIEKKLAPIVKKKDKSWIEVYRLAITSPSVLMTCASELILMPPIVWCTPGCTLIA